MTKLYQKIAKTINMAEVASQPDAIYESISDRFDAIKEKIDNLLPSGSGIDNGSQVNWQASSDNRLVIKSAYHCLDEAGYYTEWCTFKVIIKPSLTHYFRLIIQPIKSNDKRLMSEYTLKGYLYDRFYEALIQEVK